MSHTFILFYLFIYCFSLCADMEVTDMRWSEWAEFVTSLLGSFPTIVENTFHVDRSRFHR
jgi:hypothetical protein